MSRKPKILIAGASGVVGRAAVEHFSSEGNGQGKGAGQGKRADWGRRADWEVVGLSRRRWAPEVGASALHLAVDLLDRDATAAALRAHGDLTHVVYAALYEEPGLVPGWRNAEQMQTNLRMLTNLLDALAESATDLRRLVLLQGTKAYGVHLHPIASPARERWPRDPHENFYFLQEDLVRERQQGSAWSWTVLRPQIVIGHALHAPMNLLPAIGVYAAMLRHEGRPLAYPGGPDIVLEAVDSRLLARAIEWAAESPGSENEIYNVTNGDVLIWRNVWPAIAEALGMAPGPSEPISLARTLPAKSALWDAIVSQYGLQPLSLEELVGDSCVYADFTFGLGAPVGLPPALVSTVKIREAGFHACIDTEDMFRDWFRWMQDQRFLPRP